MDDHVVGLAIDVLFAGMVKVELAQFVALVAHRYETAGSVVDLDAVAIVDDLKRAGFVVELNWRQSALLGIANIHGRLPLAKLAGFVIGF